MRSRGWRTIMLQAAACVLVATSAAARDSRTGSPGGKPVLPERVITLSGEYIHNIGDLQMNVTNWGFFGSLPKSTYPMADQPSAQWPAGSGIEYLYAAGIWVGAIMNGIPSVSTGYPETEFYPSPGPEATIYESAAGMPGTRALPLDPDDDGDGLADEDPPNGRDDDGDGRIDEDYYAVGNQMFTCEYGDDDPAAIQIWPEHTPMHVQVRQESYAMGDSDFNDFVCVRYYITNAGYSFLSSVFVGIFADLDAGPRTSGSYHMDDLAGWYDGDWCAPKGEWEWPVELQVVYVYDNNGDEGRTPGYFGILLLGYERAGGYGYDYMGFQRYDVHAVRFFRGLQPYEHGGEPTNDYERYEVLSEPVFHQPTANPNDYKALMSIGPFTLPPLETTWVDIAFVAGEGLDGMLTNASRAMVVYQGDFYDLDDNPATGVYGRETPVAGPLDQGISPDPCLWPDSKVTVGEGETLWVNWDCREEFWLRDHRGCYKYLSNAIEFYWNAVFGRERRVHWVTGISSPPPGMRAIPGDGRVTLIWDDISERVPDPALKVVDFEGYEIYRADGWTRPLGTTESSGPPMDIWRLYAQLDLVNGLAPDHGIDAYRYMPLGRAPGREAAIKSFEEALWYSPFERPPCPPGFTPVECDTIEKLARARLGFEGGRRYYRLVDTTPHNGQHYFYSVIAYDHELKNGALNGIGRRSSPNANFAYVVPNAASLGEGEYEEDGVYVVPNPATTENMDPWRLDPNNADPTGIKVEFRNLPRCAATIRIYTIAGDLVEIIRHDGTAGEGACSWNLVSRNGQDVTSGVYLFSVEPSSGGFNRSIGRFVVIR